MNKQQLLADYNQNVAKILKEIERSSGVYRKFMSTQEILLCNKLVKENMLYKAKPDEKNATIAFFITNKGVEWLDINA